MFPVSRLRPAALAFLLTLTMAGCATCREHPVICSVAVATVATSIALSVQGQPSNSSQRTVVSLRVQP